MDRRSGLIAPGLIRSRTFDPIWDVDWAVLWWADGPKMAAQGYTTNSPVGVWPDERGGGSLAQAVASLKPLFKPSGGPNGRAAVQGDGVDDMLAVVATLPQPFTIVIVGQGQTDRTMGAVRNDGTSHFGYWDPLGNKWEISDGAGGGSYRTVASTADSGFHLFEFYYNGAGTPHIAEDGVTLSTDIDTLGSNGILGFYLFARSNSTSATAAPLSLCGIYVGDVASDPNWVSFKQWVTDWFGIVTS